MRLLAAIIAIAVLTGLLSSAVVSQDSSPRGWLGVGTVNVSDEEAKALGFEKPKGAKIVQITEGGPASLAHLHPGDIIVAINSEEVSNGRNLADRISALTPGSRVTLKLLRSGETSEQEVVLAARAEELPDQSPILRIEPGMHTGPINRIGVDGPCSLMVTGSDDKTVRLWALPEGGHGSPNLLRTLRVPIGEGDDGKIYAVALSPNGGLAAGGGWNHPSSVDKAQFVYIFDATTGRLVTRLRGVGVIKHLTFSPDGSRLAVTRGGGQGLQLWETSSWRLLAEHKDYGGKPSSGAAFDGANRIYTVAKDGQIRRYGPDGRIEAKAFAQGGREPRSIAVHPNGNKLAIGFVDTAAVEVYDASTLNRLYAADTSGITYGNLASVSWSADGARLYAGGRYRGGSDLLVLIWQDEGRGKRSEVPLSQNTILQFLPCGGGMAVGASDPAFGLIAPDGNKLVWQEGVTADMRGKLRDAFTLSADGSRVRFGLGVGGEQPVLFDLASFSLSDAPQPGPGLAAPKISGLAVADWKDKFTPKLNGKPIALKSHQRSRSLSRRRCIDRPARRSAFAGVAADERQAAEKGRKRLLARDGCCAGRQPAAAYFSTRDASKVTSGPSLRTTFTEFGRGRERSLELAVRLWVVASDMLNPQPLARPSRRSPSRT